MFNLGPLDIVGVLLVLAVVVAVLRLAFFRRSG